MDFELSDDEAALADGIRSLCAGRFPLEKLRSAEGGDGLLDSGMWGELAEAGVFSLQVPESAGGVGLGRGSARGSPANTRPGRVGVAGQELVAARAVVASTSAWPGVSRFCVALNEHRGQ